MASAGYLDEPFKEDRAQLPVGTMELLKGGNYREWSLTMQMVLRQRGLIQFIEDPPPVILSSWDDEKKAKFRSRKGAALATIYLGVHPGHRGLLEGQDDPRMAWDVLKNTFEPSSRAHIAALRSEYLSIRYKEGESMGLFVARVENAVRRLRAAGKTIDDDEVAYHLIAYLPAEYEGVINTVYLWKDADFTTAKVKEALFAQYGRLHEKEGLETVQDTSSAYQFQSTGSRRGTQQGYQRGRGLSLQRNDTRICYGCRKPGHIARDCPDKRKFQTTGVQPEASQFIRRGGGGQKMRGQSNMVRGGFYVAAYLGTGFKKTDRPMKELTLTFDTAATHHIITDRDSFCEYKPLEDARVRFGVHDVEAKGIGTVQLKFGQNGQTVLLKKALHVPALDRHLLSWCALDEEGYKAEMKKKVITISGMDGEVVGRAYLKDRFYQINASCCISKLNSEGSAHAAKSVQQPVTSKVKLRGNDLMTWHRRFAHSNCQTISTMSKKALVLGLEQVTGREENCDACRAAKCTRSTHSKIGTVTTKDTLELVHSDVWGPAPVETFGGGKYFISFIDDFTREAVVYILKRKSEAFEAFQDYRTCAERQTGKKLRRLRTDNGLEYCSHKFAVELRKSGIKHERTNFYSPQMNGVAERFNRTALEAIRATLEDAALPRGLWGELLLASTYVRNRVMHSTTREIPSARWLGHKPSVRHLKRLGCLAYVHLKAKYRNKLESRVKKGVLIGYAIRTKGYRIWFPDDNRVVETIHVSFDEGKMGVVEFPKHTDVLDTSSAWIEDVSDPEEDMRENPKPSLEDKLQEEGPIRRTPTVQPGMGASRQHGAPTGWRREEVPRVTGQRVDVYFYSPGGKRLRSTKEVARYCAKESIPYNPDEYDWKARKEGPTGMSSDSSENETTEIHSDDETLNLAGAYKAEVIIPESYEEAMQSVQAESWQAAMGEKLSMMEERNVWKEVQNPQGVESIGTKWIYSLKKDNKGEIQRYKARLVAQGQYQRAGLDYAETYSPVVNFCVVRLFIILLLIVLGWKVEQLDVKNAYLYGEIDRLIFLKLPKAYQVKNSSTTHLKLLKGLYGLHQSGRLWHEELDGRLLGVGFRRFTATQCVYTWGSVGVVLVYVDDILVFGKTSCDLEKIIQKLEKVMDVKRLGEISVFLGVTFKRDGKAMIMEQEGYITECMRRFGEDPQFRRYIPMHPGQSSLKEICQEEKQELKKPYRELIGCLMFLAQRTRPDAAFAIGVLSQHVSSPTTRHWARLQELLQYVYHSKDLQITYKKTSIDAGLTVYVDADWAASTDDRKSISGYVIFLYGQLLGWRTVKQKSIALSTMEAEYMALAEVCKEVIWLLRILRECKEFGIVVGTPVIYCDNQAAISFTRNKMENSRTKHIDIKYQFVKDLVEKQEVEIRHIPTASNIADMFTKAIARRRFEELRCQVVSSSASMTGTMGEV